MHFFIFISKLSRYIELERAHIIYEQQIQNTLKQIQGNEHSLKTLKREYHDFKNKIIYIQNLAQKNDCTEIMKYIHEYLHIAEPFVPVVNTGKWSVRFIDKLQAKLCDQSTHSFLKRILKSRRIYRLIMMLYVLLLVMD